MGRFFQSKPLFWSSLHWLLELATESYDGASFQEKVAVACWTAKPQAMSAAEVTLMMASAAKM